jgi:hypothetical protein
MPKQVRHMLTVAGTAQELSSYDFRSTNYDFLNHNSKINNRTSIHLIPYYHTKGVTKIMTKVMIKNKPLSSS